MTSVFHEGWETTEDDGRSGRPSNVCIPKKIQASPDSSCNKITIQMSDQLNISKMACREILCEDLGRRKLNAESRTSKRRIVL
jgi:hypothetical protein